MRIIQVTKSIFFNPMRGSNIIWVLNVPMIERWRVTDAWSLWLLLTDWQWQIGSCSITADAEWAQTRIMSSDQKKTTFKSCWLLISSIGKVFPDLKTLAGSMLQPPLRTYRAQLTYFNNVRNTLHLPFGKGNVVLTTVCKRLFCYPYC